MASPTPIYRIGSFILSANAKTTPPLAVPSNFVIVTLFSATALLNSTTNVNTELPNEPYAPLTESVVLSYTASDTIVLNVATVEDFEGAENAFYHEDVFGYAKRHPYLRSQLNFLTNENISLV